MHIHPQRHGVHMTDAPPPRLEVVPRHREPYRIATEEPAHVKREPAPAENTCGANGNSKCAKPTDTTTTTTLPVVLGAVVPIVAAIIVLYFLHRRHIKKLRREDANDRTKSLDFGLDMGPTSGRAGMRETYNPFNRGHAKGISMDVGHPYLLPHGMNNSRNSLNSLPVSIGDDSKYRAANTHFPGDAASMRSQSKGPQDDTSSSFTGFGEDTNQGLLRNAQRMSRTSAPLYEEMPVNHNIEAPPSHGQGHPAFQLDLPRSDSLDYAPPHQTNEQAPGMSNVGPDPYIATMARGGSLSQDANPRTEQPQGALPTINTPNEDLHINGYPEGSHDFPLQDNSASYLGSTHAPTHSDNADLPPTPTPRISLPSSDGASDYAHNRKSTFMVPDVNVSGQEDVQGYGGAKDPVTPPEGLSHRQTLAPDSHRDTRRLTLGVRPLPPEDPSDDPEQRANRIRSFYKEYFDESNQGRETVYYEDYDPELYNAFAFDDDYNYPPPRPFAEPVGRRAMTPPPRAPPRFQGPPRHMGTGSMGGFSGYNSPGPRAFSSASGRFPGGRGPPRRPPPPPAPLQELPTPHMLSRDDAIMQAGEFAPGKNFRDQREGRAGTPLGGLRPFSPMAPVASPLASSFDELSVMPSPHALRKSGTYTNLDFAPPPRFKNTETDSDAGSIRSNRTGISYTHMHNIRTGAYRVSRLPPDTVGTKGDIMASLRPNWDMKA